MLIFPGKRIGYLCIPVLTLPWASTVKICGTLVLSLVLLLSPPGTRQGLAARLSFERPMMGTSVEVILWHFDPEASEKAVDQAFAEIKRIEELLSVWRRESKVSEINRSAGERPVQVPPELFGLIRESIRISGTSDGAFDITVQGLGDLWDFHSPVFRVPDAEVVEDRLNLVDYRKIHLQQEGSTVFLEEEGMQISLGGIAKGYAVDRAVAVLRESGIKGGIVSAGGDLVAFGKREDGGPWKVGVRNPRAPSKNISVIPVSNLAVATSGDYERYRVVAGRRYHHIIDPRKGYPSRGCMSVTVVAEHALEADALATAVFVLGLEEGRSLLEKLPDVEGIIVDGDGKIAASSGLQGTEEPSREEKPDRPELHRKHNKLLIE
jgi:thiamine biosynthesis lipoprotein